MEKTYRKIADFDMRYDEISDLRRKAWRDKFDKYLLVDNYWKKLMACSVFVTNRRISKFAYLNQLFRNCKYRQFQLKKKML